MVEVVEKDALSVVGMEYRGQVDGPQTHAEISALWQKFVGELLKMDGTFDVMFGACQMLSDSEFLYLAAVPMPPQAGEPPGMVRWSMPPSQYAVFPHRGDISRIRETYRQAEEWLRNSPAYERGRGPDFECYDERFQENSPDSLVEIYVPVVKAQPPDQR